MSDVRRVARIVDQSGERSRYRARDTAGKEKASGLSSITAGVAEPFQLRWMASTPISYASSKILRYSRQPHSSAAQIRSVSIPVLVQLTARPRSIKCILLKYAS
jgi:hypothetical protein